jgi:nitrate/nitrite transporter NarK
LPPSTARYLAAQQPSPTPLTYYQSVKRIVTNRNYILLLFTYGINVGVFYAMSTLLNQVVLQHFPVRNSTITPLIVIIGSELVKNPKMYNNRFDFPRAKRKIVAE